VKWQIKTRLFNTDFCQGSLSETQSNIYAEYGIHNNYILMGKEMAYMQYSNITALTLSIESRGAVVTD
jgi:hypothetical protein